MWETFYLEIVKTGIWNGLTFTKPMLKGIVKNFETEKVVPITAGHIPDEDYKSSTVQAKITKMQLSKDENTINAEMQLSGWMLEKWKNGEFLKPSIELYKHEKLGWLISTVALLGEESAGVKNLNTDIKPFSDIYEKFIFCDEFKPNKKLNDKNNIDDGGQKMTKTLEEIEKELNVKNTKKFSDEIGTLQTSLSAKDAEIEALKLENKKFADEKEALAKETAEKELKKYNDNVEVKKTEMTKSGYLPEDIKKFSDKYTGRVEFAEILNDVMVGTKKAKIGEPTKFSDNHESEPKKIIGMAEVVK